MIEWINKIFGIKNEVSVPTIISIIVFVTGGIINYIFIKIREYNSRKLNRNTFRLLLAEVIKDLKIKEKNMSKFYPQIVLTREDRFRFSQKTISYLDTIFEFDFKEIYYSFRKKFFFTPNKKLKDKSFHKIWAILRNLEFFEERLHNSLDAFTKTYSEQLGEYNAHLEKYREYNEQQIHKYNGVSFPDNEKIISDFLNNEKIIWYAWLDLGEIRTHYYYSYNNLVLPLLELNRKYSELPITQESGRLLVLCELDYREIESTINTNYLIFKNYYLTYRRDQQLLKKCLEII